MDTNCPTCQSGATQAVGMAVLTGTRSWAGNHVSTGFNGHPRVGASWGTSQSSLAAALDPGPCPSYITVAAGVLLAWSFVVFIVAANLAPPLGAIVVTSAWACAPIAFFRRRQRRREWLARCEALAGAWVCRKCGTTWTP